MASKSKISIITVNLNNLSGLEKTMESVIKQSWQEFEYIIIDGGSTDGSRKYIESHKENIDYWVSEPDKGIYHGMNKGIKAANGEFLLFLNSGDWLYDDNVLQRVTEKLGNCDVLYGNMIKVFNDGQEILDKGVNGNPITLSVFIRGTINHSSSFINKEVFIKYGFYDESLKIVSDWKLFLEALGLNYAKVVYLDKTISKFDMYGVSNSNITLRSKERKKILREKVPLPIYADYLKLQEYEGFLNSSRFKKFMKNDKKRFTRVLHSIIFKCFPN